MHRLNNFALTEHFPYIDIFEAEGFAKTLLRIIPPAAESFSEMEQSKGTDQWENSYARVHMDYDLGDSLYWDNTDPLVSHPWGLAPEEEYSPLHLSSLLITILEPPRPLLKHTAMQYVTNTSHMHGAHRDRVFAMLSTMTTEKHIRGVYDQKLKPAHRVGTIMTTIASYLEDRPVITDNDEEVIIDKYDQYLTRNIEALIRKHQYQTNALEVIMAKERIDHLMECRETLTRFL